MSNLQCVLMIFTPSTIPQRPISIPYPPNVMSSFFFPESIESNLYIPNSLAYEATPWSAIDLQRTHPLKKIHSLKAVISFQQPLSYGWDSVSSDLPSCAGISSGWSLWRSCVCWHTFCKCTCVLPWGVWKTPFGCSHPPPLAFRILLPPPLHWSLSLGMKEYKCPI